MKETEGETMTYDLFDEKGSCEICSTSTVKRRIEKSAQSDHAKRHIDAGDPVVLRLAKFVVDSMLQKAMV